MSSVLDKISERDFIELVALCGGNIKTDPGVLYKAFKEHRADHEKKLSLPPEHPLKNLENKWYSSLDNRPEYSVYGDDFYMCDIWLCWVMYSRKGLIELNKPASLFGISVVEFLKRNKIATIADLGCGFGYTTAALKEYFPEARVTGTNLEESFQFAIARSLGGRLGFSVLPSLSASGQIDLIFASEYFEHIETPLEHLKSILVQNRPRCLILANGFTGRAIGHFNYYKHLGQRIKNTDMSKVFKQTLNEFGYQKLKTKIWNNRPSVWIKT